MGRRREPQQPWATPGLLSSPGPAFSHNPATEQLPNSSLDTSFSGDGKLTTDRDTPVHPAGCLGRESQLWGSCVAYVEHSRRIKWAGRRRHGRRRSIAAQRRSISAGSRLTESTPDRTQGKSVSCRSIRSGLANVRPGNLGRTPKVPSRRSNLAGMWPETATKCPSGEARSPDGSGPFDLRAHRSPSVLLGRRRSDDAS